MTKKQTTIITALSVIAFILALLVTRQYWLRFDLTKNKAYTISKVSRNIHRELPDPVTITYYLSNKLKTVVSSPGEIEDMLREYAAHSRGKIRLVVRDPLRAGASERVEELGLQPRQVPVVEQDQTSLITVYSGIVIEYLDKMEILPWVISTDTLEYDLTSRIRSLVRDTDRWIAVIIGDSLRQWNEHFGFLNAALADAGFRVRLISPGEEIPDNTPGLFVLGGMENLDEWSLYRIDRYIQLGGKVFFAVEGVYVDTINNNIEARALQDMGLLSMLASYGVVVRPELALDRNALTLRYQTIAPNGGIQFRIMRYPLWIGIPGNQGNANHPITSNFNGLDLYWPSPLVFNIGAGSDVEAAALFASSPNAWSMKTEYHINPEVPYMFEIEANETRGEKIFGVSLSGVLPSYFRDSPKPFREGSEEELPDMPENSRASRVIVVGDVDFATNLVNATEARHNLEFLLRAAGWLVSDDDIISIRNRQPQIGRFDKISEPGLRSASMKFSQILNVGLIPLLVIAAGVIRATRRSRGQRTYYSEQKAENSNLRFGGQSAEADKKENNNDV